MLDRIAEFFIFGIVPLAAGMLATPIASVAAEQTMKGEVVYRERIALPPNALVTVRLADVSLADAPSAIVAEQTIKPAGQVPIAFELKFDTSAILEKNTYALQARITVDDTLMFLNDERHEVDPLAGTSQVILVKMVNEKAAAAPISGQTWALRFIDGIGAVDSKATLRVEEDGKVAGQAPCNRYFAHAVIKGTAIGIDKPGATMMACDEKLMTQEAAFFGALEKIASFVVENGGLTLKAADGRDLLRFAASA